MSCPRGFAVDEVEGGGRLEGMIAGQQGFGGKAVAQRVDGRGRRRRDWQGAWQGTAWEFMGYGGRENPAPLLQ